MKRFGGKSPLEAAQEEGNPQTIRVCCTALMTDI